MPKDRSMATKSRAASAKREYSCPNCSTKLSTIKNYRLHMKTAHSIECEKLNSIYHAPEETESISVMSTLSPKYKVTSSSHVCPNCSKIFYKVGKFRRHLRSHLELPSYACKHCPDTYFFEKEKLFDHMHESHQGEKNIKCKECDQFFYSKSASIQHAAGHIKRPPYNCKMCEGTFPSFSRLVRHERFHTHICPACSNRFRSRHEILNHIEVDHKGIDQEGKKILGFINEPEYKSYKRGRYSCVDFDELGKESDADSFTSDDSSSSASTPKRIKRWKKKNPCIVCFICERRFPTQRYLEHHMKYHLIFFCRHCPKFYHNETSLQHHEVEHQ